MHGELRLNCFLYPEYVLLYILRLKHFVLDTEFIMLNTV